MAGPTAFLVMPDLNNSRVVYKIHIESVPSADDHGEAAPPVSVHPVARWPLPHAFAVSGSSILAIAAGSRDTVVRDTVTQVDAPGPRLRVAKRQPALLPVGDDTVLVMDRRLRACCFEVLRRLPGGGGWRADPVPEPPLGFMLEDDPDEHDPDGVFVYVKHISAYFAMGKRVWITVSLVGTVSLDTERGTWRVEGSWELPFRMRGFFAPELGSAIGIADDFKGHCVEVCAVDVEARPPVVRQVWQIPAERPEPRFLVNHFSLAYLGNARFCLSSSVVVGDTSTEIYYMNAYGTAFTEIYVRRLPNGELELAKRESCIHTWPVSHFGQGYSNANELYPEEGPCRKRQMKEKCSHEGVSSFLLHLLKC
ncbi:hypothetical protein ACP70R_028378 [Stipagrostis hirtigluma subsp. patula]